MRIVSQNILLRFHWNRLFSFSQSQFRQLSLTSTEINSSTWSKRRICQYHHHHLFSSSTTTTTTTSPVIIRSIHANSNSGEQDVKKDEQQQKVEMVLMPSFEDVLDQLCHVGSILVSIPTNQTNYNSLLNQLRSMNTFATCLNNLIQTPNTNEHWILEQIKANLVKQVLSSHTPLPVWSNEAMLYANFVPDNRQLSTNFLIEFISAQILSIIDYRLKLKLSHFDQLRRQMFGSYRTANKGADEHVLGKHDATSDTNSSFTIAIARNSNYFLLELNDQMVQGEQFFVLKRVIEYILNHQEMGTTPFGVLSTLPRQDASFGYQFLYETTLTQLREAEFLVNLDHIDADNGTVKFNQLAKEMLAPSEHNVSNRWFDKTIQLVILLANDDGKQLNRIISSGVCYERSLVDSRSVLDMIQHSTYFLTTFKPNEIQPNLPRENTNEQVMIKLQKLNLASPGKQNIVHSAALDFSLPKYRTLLNSVDVKLVEFLHYGQKWFDQQNIMIESWIAVALGLAYNQLKPSTSEFRGVTQQMLDYFEDSFSGEKLQLALESHHQLNEIGYVYNMLQLYGDLAKNIDDASFLQSKQLLKQLIDLPVWKEVNMHTLHVQHSVVHQQRDHLSNSNDRSKYVSGVTQVVGPCVPNGVCACYQLVGENRIVFSISYHHQDNDVRESLGKFCQLFEQALVQMKSIVTKNL